MIRIKVTLLYILLVAALTGSIVFLVHYDLTSSLKASAENSLRRSANLSEQTARLDEASLLAKAQFIASRESLYQAMTGDTELANTKGEDGKELDFDEKRHLTVHEKLLAQSYKLEAIAETAKGKRNIELNPLARRPHELDIFMALDSKGIGVAALGKDRFSWFGDDVSIEHPGVKKLGMGVGEARIEYWRWSFSGDEKRLYRVAIAPIRPSESDNAEGVVVVGSRINDGIAVEKQRILAGGDERTEEGLLNEAPEVVYLYGKEIEASTFSSEKQEAVANAIAESSVGDNSATITEIAVGEVTYLAMLRTLSADKEKPFKVAVMASLPSIMTIVGQLRVNILLIGGIFLVLGAILLLVIVMAYVRRLEEVESGIQEVIAGNKDYEWESVKGHPFQSSLAQSLNLMSAFLQGKPMPDDDGSGGSWSADSMEDLSKAPEKKPKMAGVDLSSLQSSSKKDDGEG